MDILRLSQVAQAYYEGLKAPSLAQGWEKNVVTDGNQCLFVSRDYEPAKGEVIFLLMTRNHNTMCQLIKSNL